MEDHQFMTHALALGRRNQGHCWPNPAVGCVIVKEGRVVGRGWTAIGGRPHAEAQALQRAGALAAGATAFVTLEPCAHQGQTGPCCDALIAAKVARVVIGAADPDPRVAGRGVAALKAAGIEVVEGVEGITEASKYLDYPVVSGNVSFYNETKDKGIKPTPAIGGVGLIIERQ